LDSHEIGLGETAIAGEWLLTDGLGGFASSTVRGPNTRRYHGWLVPEVERYGGRFVALASVLEEARAKGRTYDLTGISSGDAAGPDRSASYLHGFTLDPLPVSTYCLDGLFFERFLAMPRGQRRILAIYSLPEGSPAKIDLVLRPLVTFRFYHHLLRANDWPFRVESGRGWVTVEPYPGAPILVLRFAPAEGAWHADGGWRRGFEYSEERQRGLDCVEDLYSPGWLEWTGLTWDQGATLSAALAEDREEAVRRREAPFDFASAVGAFKAEAARQRAVAGEGRKAIEVTRAAAGPAGAGARAAPSGEGGAAVAAMIDPASPQAGIFLDRLFQAADAFIALRPESPPAQATASPASGASSGPPGLRPRTSVIAGFPWFEDWGRDTLIALPGLFLVPRRFREAFEVLRDYASFVRDGLVPNRFPDLSTDPDYGAADASLWLFRAVQAYLAYTGDLDGVRKTFLDLLRDIAGCYLRGTHLGIGAGPDGLLRAGAPGLAVTWMDARFGDWVVTPRRGYPVELSALWYNALCFLAELEQTLPGRESEARRWTALAERVKVAFGRRFWNDSGGCLVDVLEDGPGDGPGEGPGGGERTGVVDASVRPNQVLALALPYAVLTRDRWGPVLRTCLEELYTPYGLRTLAPSAPGYRGIYRGGPVERDRAYHQGTVWPWLIGPLITGLCRAEGWSRAVRLRAARMILPFVRHLSRAGVGQISEVFDGDHPHLPGGCIAQAWSVAEILRAYVEDVLHIRPGGADGD
jgi:glycogen debranching enzyme